LYRLLYSVYDAYSFHVIPVMGQIIAGDWKSYQYLVESIRQFPCQARLDFLSLSHSTLLPEDAYSGSAVLLCVLMAICVSHLSLSDTHCQQSHGCWTSLAQWMVLLKYQ